MKDKGTMILLLIFLTMICFYFGLNGFSRNAATRWGQYAGVFIVFYFTIDEFFKEE